MSGASRLAGSFARWASPRSPLPALVAGTSAHAGGVSGPAFYVDHQLYRTVATPTDLSGTGAPAQSWDTIYGQARRRAAQRRDRGAG